MNNQAQDGKISVYKRGLCYSNVLATGTKDFVSTASEALVGTLMAIGDATISSLYVARCKIHVKFIKHVRFGKHGFERTRTARSKRENSLYGSE